MSYVLNMNFVDFQKALIATNIISRRKNLIDMAIQDYPNAKAEDRKKMHKSTYEQAYPNQKEKVVSVSDLIKDRSLLNGR